MANAIKYPTNIAYEIWKHVGQFLVTTEHLPVQWYRIHSSNDEYIQDKTTGEMTVKNPITPLSVLFGMSNNDCDDLLLAAGLFKQRGDKRIYVPQTAWERLKGEFKLSFDIYLTSNKDFLAKKRIFYIRFGKDKSKRDFISVADQGQAVLLDDYKFDYHFKISIYQNKLLRNIVSTLIKYQLLQSKTNEIIIQNTTSPISKEKLSNENKPSASSNNLAQTQNQRHQSESSNQIKRAAGPTVTTPKNPIQIINILKNPVDVENELLLRKHIGQFLASIEFLPAHWYRICSSMNEYIQNIATNEMEVKNPVLPLSDLFGMKYIDSDNLLLAAGLLKQNDEQFEVPLRVWRLFIVEFKLSFDIREVTNKHYFSEQPMYCIQFGKDKTKRNFATMGEQIKAVLLNKYKFESPDTSSHQKRLVCSIVSTLMKFQISLEQSNKENNNKCTTASTSDEISKKKSHERKTLDNEKTNQATSKIDKNQSGGTNTGATVPIIKTPKNAIRRTDTIKYTADMNNEILLRKHIGQFLVSIEYLPAHWYRVCSSTNEYIQNKITHEMPVQNPVLPLSDLLGMSNREADDLLLAAGLLKREGEEHLEVLQNIWDKFKTEYKLNFWLHQFSDKTFLSEQPIYYIRFGKDTTKGYFATPVGQSIAVLLDNYKLDRHEISSYQETLACNITSTELKFQISLHRSNKDKNSKRAIPSTSDEGSNKKSDECSIVDKDKANQAISKIDNRDISNKDETSVNNDILEYKNQEQNKSESSGTSTAENAVHVPFNDPVRYIAGNGDEHVLVRIPRSSNKESFSKNIRKTNFIDQIVQNMVSKDVCVEDAVTWLLQILEERNSKAFNKYILSRGYIVDEKHKTNQLNTNQVETTVHNMNNSRRSTFRKRTCCDTASDNNNNNDENTIIKDENNYQEQVHEEEEMIRTGDNNKKIRL